MGSDTTLSAKIDSAVLYDRTQCRLNNQLSKAIVGQEKQSKKGLHQHLLYQSSTEIQNQEFYHEKIKQLVSLNAIYRDMQLDLSVDALCLRILGHIKQAMQFVEWAIPLIEIDGKPYTLEKNVAPLTTCLSADIVINKKQRGRIKVFYSAENTFLLPDEQDYINTIADDLSAWLARKHVIVLREQLLQDINMIEHALDAHAIIAITNKKGRITHANNKFCLVSKYSREELLGQDHRIINSGYHSKTFMSNLWKTIASGNIWKNKIKNRAKDGSFYWVDTTIVPFLDEAGNVYQYVAIRTEITEHILLEQELEERMAELARSNDELEQFAYVVTHDLQEPIRAIAGFVQLLKRRYHDQLDEKANEYISHTLEGAKRMQMFIDGLLTYSQVNADQSFVTVDCDSILDNVLINLSATIDETQAVITHDPLPSVPGISFQLMQLFGNLISNALKFHSQQSPRIHISVVSKKDSFVFSIKDNGIGMEAQYKERVFRVFQRLHTRREYPGTGVGLAICKKIIDHHNGEIWVESKLGEGSTFYFTIQK